MLHRTLMFSFLWIFFFGSGLDSRVRAQGPAQKDEQPADKVRVAVLELRALGIRGPEIELLEKYLRTSVATIGTVDVISPLDIAIALEKPSHAKVKSCKGGVQCAVGVGKLVGADVVVFGTVGGIGDNFVLNLRALDVKTGKEIRRKKAEVSGSRHDLIPEIRLAAYALIAPERIRGSLVLEVNMDGVDVAIDGRSVGQTPLPEPIRDLSIGSHVVRLQRRGFDDYEHTLVVRPFDPTRLRVDFEKRATVKSVKNDD